MNKIKSIDTSLRILAGVAVAGLGIAAHAADPMTTATGGNLARSDRTFVTKAGVGGMEEVALGQLAQKNGQSQAVKDFGARMVKDHTAANEDLVKVAASQSVTVPGELDRSAQSDVDKLSKKSGADFDKAYVKAMVSDHKTDISLFEKEAKSGKDPELQAFAEKTLPTLQEHLQMIEGIQTSMK
jgi:putative membrane protein